MKTHALIVVTVLALHGAATAQKSDQAGKSPAGPAVPPVDIVITEGRAILLGLDEVIVSGIVRGYSVSPDDRYIAVLRMEDPHMEHVIGNPSALRAPFPDPAIEILIWDEANRRMLQPVNLGKGVLSSPRLSWLSDGSAVVVQLDRREDVMRDGRPGKVRTFESVTVNARTGRVIRRSWSPEPGGFMVTAVSPVLPVAVEIAYANGNKYQEGSNWRYDQTIRLTSFDRNGRVNAVKEVELEDRYFGRDWKWSRDGRSLMLQSNTLGNKSTPGQRVVIVFDPVTLEYTETRQGLEVYSPQNLAFDATLVPVPVYFERLDNTSRMVATWLEGDAESFSPRALVCVAPQAARLSPKGGFLHYSRPGALVIRRITIANRQILEQARNAALRTEALRDARQVAKATIIFAMKNDDQMPTAAGARSDLRDYVKDSSILDNFVFTFQGGRLSDVENPATTVLGYTLVEGGRVVAYVDGHVEWEEK